MTARLNAREAAPDIMKAVGALHLAVENSGLEKSLIELVKIRGSQINGCAYCIHQHTSDARKAGERDDRMLLLPVWREARHIFTPREQAALAWTEVVTQLDGQPIPDAEFAALRPHFTEPEIVKLTVAIGMINLWNRIGVPFGMTPDVKTA
jgi:AhpD family alkylhydroperoxidase